MCLILCMLYNNFLNLQKDNLNMFNDILHNIYFYYEVLILTKYLIIIKINEKYYDFWLLNLLQTLHNFLHMILFIILLCYRFNMWYQKTRCIKSSIIIELWIYWIIENFFIKLSFFRYTEVHLCIFFKKSFWVTFHY
jgi:hypothetical protein